jgi:predicted SprT family Zn-dependent metalloprotease
LISPAKNDIKTKDRLGIFEGSSMKAIAATLPLPYRLEDIRLYFEIATDRNVLLTFMEGSSSIVSWRETPEGDLLIRLHRILLNADEAVFNEVAEGIRKDRSRFPLVREFIRRNREALLRSDRGKGKVSTKGRVYELDRIYMDINARYFENRVTAGITWGRNSRRRSIRQRTLGCYDERTRLIRINPCLDRKNIPLYVIENVVYHEMLHAYLGIHTVGGRRKMHTDQFRRMERFFLHYEKARKWEEDHGYR